MSTHTYFPSCMYFAQTLRLVLYSPHLEQLLKESRLCPVIHYLHVCRDWVVFPFDELLQQPFSEEKKTQNTLICQFIRNTWLDLMQSNTATYDVQVIKHKLKIYL